MSYKFEKIDNSFGTLRKEDIIYDYGVNYDSLSQDEKVLSDIAWHGWTTDEIQLIMDNSEPLSENESYEYQVEGSDLYIIIEKEKVNFYAIGSSESDLTWAFDKFVDFMGKFKKFIEENS